MNEKRSGLNLYSNILRPLLFRLNAETAHHGAVEACRWLGAMPGAAALARTMLETRIPMLNVEVDGLRFVNPIGLAAGWDKSGRALRMIDALGLGFAEIGSVSARPSLGNPKPRLFRLPADRAIVVNYGLPNDGAAVVAERLARYRPRHPLGVNIVKTNDGPDAPVCSDDEILSDYELSVTQLHPHASYVMLNLSCPNAAGGKDFFASPGNISRLLERLAPLGITCPVFLKISPQDDPAAQDRVLMESDAFPFIRGFCFNLPAGKPKTLALRTTSEKLAQLPGAVAGKPVESLINRCIAGLYGRMDRRRYIIIGAGGVFNADDAYLKIRLGASLIQVYTSMVYHGPGVVKRICCGLADLLKRDGFANVSQAVGVDSHRELPR